MARSGPRRSPPVAKAALVAALVLAAALGAVSIGVRRAPVAGPTAPALQPQSVPAPRSDNPPHDRASGATRKPQQIEPHFFAELVRTMQRGGLPAAAAENAAQALAGMPELDEIGALTVAGCLPRYLAITGMAQQQGLSELTGYILQPAAHGYPGRDRAGLIDAALQAQVEGKLRTGNHAAAERLVERALLERFNPALARKIFVPW